MIYVNSPHAPGVVGLSCGELSRYVAFHACFDAVQAPPGSHKEYGIGYDTAMNSNDVIRKMHPTDQWVWIMDDDHTFPSDVLIELLNREVDLVVPAYPQRKFPFWPVLYTARPDGRFEHIALSDLKGQTGLVKIDSAGKGGVFIRRPVLAAMAGADCVCPAPTREGEERTHRPDCVWPRTTWFEFRGLLGEDHVFFTKARELGFQPYADLDQAMEHLTTIGVAMKRLPDGEWVIELNLQNRVRVVVREEGQAA